MPAATPNAMRWVGRTKRVTYRNRAARNTDSVATIAAPTIPSVWASNMALMAPRTKPSSRA